MTKRMLIICAALMLAVLACNFPGFKSNPSSPAPTPTPDPGLQVYEGKGMRITLPNTYVTADIKEELPAILETLTNILGTSEGPLSSLVTNLEDDVSWLGYDSGATAVSPTRLLVVRNTALAKLPVSVLTLALEQILGNQTTLVNRDSLSLNGRSVTRLTYSHEADAWAGYVFTEQSQLWLVLFLTTPANMAAQQANFEISVGSIEIDAVQP